MKNQKGITLIALVITIIVLLILAGVSISMVIGENGILTQADTATVETRKAAAKEEIELAWASVDSEYWTAWTNNSSVQKGDYFEAEDLNKYLVGKGTVSKVVDNGDGTYTVVYTSASNGITYIIVIDSNGNVQSLSEDNCKEYVPWINTMNQTYYFERQSEDESSDDYYVWKSNNGGVDRGRAISYFSITVEEETTYSFNWSISSEASDTATLLFVDAKSNQTILANGISGEQSKTETVTLTPGENQILIGYMKNSSVNEGDDCMTITLKDAETRKHIYDEGVVTKEQTCNEEGIAIYTCVNCGIKKTETIAKHRDKDFDIWCDDCNIYLAGLYDENNKLLCLWEDSGIDIERDNESYESLYKEETTSAYYVLTNYYPKTTKIVLPNEITKLGDCAFASCSKLTSIKLSNNITSIGSQAFFGTSITSVGPMGSNASIEIPNSITGISYQMFEFCYELANVEIPSHVTSIGAYAFAYCENLTSVGPVGSNASIEIPDSVTKIGDNAFWKCIGLTYVEVPNGIATISHGLFQECISLTKVVILDNITQIESDAFYKCTSLTSVEISNSVTEIVYLAFGYCTNLKTIYIPSSVESMPKVSTLKTGPFYQCSSDLKIYCGASSKQSGWNTYWNYYTNTEILEVEYGVTREQYNSIIGE